MSRRIFDFDPPDRFVTDAIGDPGQRVFYLQASQASRTVTVALEKVQVAVLADRLAALLGELRERGESVPETAGGDDDQAPLREPIEEAFRVGTLTMAWDPEGRRVVLEAREMTEDEASAEEAAEAAMEDDDEDPEGPDLVRVRIAPRDAVAFVERAQRVLAAGRPPCPLCGAPLNPEGHLCPRRNGYVH